MSGSSSSVDSSAKRLGPRLRTSIKGEPSLYVQYVDATGQSVNKAALEIHVPIRMILSSSLRTECK